MQEKSLKQSTETSIVFPSPPPPVFLSPPPRLQRERDKDVDAMDDSKGALKLYIHVSTGG